MATTVADLRAQALELPYANRIALARELLEPHEEEISEREADEMWAEVVAERLDALDRGESVPVSREEVMRRIDQMLARKRQTS